MKRKARELKHEEEDKAKSTKHAEKVKEILAELTAKEIQEQTTEQESHKYQELQQLLQESAGERGQEELRHLQQVAAEALAKQFQFPIGMAETAVKVVEKALVEAAHQPGLREIDPEDI